MRARTWMILGLSLSCAAGCKRDDKAKEAEPKKDAPPTAPGAPAPRPAETAALWDRAPKDTVFGIVVGPGAGGKVVGALEETKRIANQTTRGRELWSKLQMEMSDAPFDVFDRAAYGKAGIDISRGAAMFIDAAEKPFAVVPVSDRQAFLTLTEGKTETVDGKDYDRIGKAYCQFDEDTYLCADEPALLANFGGKGAIAQKVIALAPELRGDLEMVALFDRIPDSKDGLRDFAPYMEKSDIGVLSARLGRGSLQVRGWLGGTPRAPIAGTLSGVPFDPAVHEVSKGASSTLAFRIPLGVFGATNEMPASMPVGGIDVRKDVVDQLTGQVEFGVHGGDNELGVGVMLGIGMKSTDVLGKNLQGLCEMAKAVPGVSVQGAPGKCSGTVDPKAIPGAAPAGAPVSQPVAVSVETSPTAVVIRVGGPKAGTGAGTQAAGPIAREIVESAWTVATWSRWNDPLGADGSVLRELMAMSEGQMSAQDQAVLDMGRLVLAHLYETAFAGRVDERGGHFAAEITTMAADSPEAYAAYSKAVATGIESGKPYLPALAEVTKAHPDSLAARQTKMLEDGAPSVAFGAGIAAAIAIPAFTRYMERSRAVRGPESQEITP